MPFRSTVGSAVVFENGEPRRAAYRHMRIKGNWGNDDFASMEEVVRRYFRRRRDEQKPLPDLAVIDGGKGQLSAATSALASLEIEDVAVIALAKREEEVFVPGSGEPILLDRRNRALHLLQRIRDEAHRFAVRYNRKLRSKRTIRSELGEIHHAVDAGVLRADDCVELGAIVAGDAAGRETDEQITVADLTGVGAQDAAMASATLQAAREKGFGTAIES